MVGPQLNVLMATLLFLSQKQPCLQGKYQINIMPTYDKMEKDNHGELTHLVLRQLLSHLVKHRSLVDLPLAWILEYQ